MSLSREEIAARYSKALFEYAQDTDSLEQVYSDMNALEQAVKENPTVINLLADPILSTKEKEKFLATISEDLTPESKKFLEFLLAYGRFNNFVEIITSFDNLYDHYKNIATGTVTSAVKLTKTELSKISQAYAKKYGLNDLILTNKVEPSILGGVILQVGDRIIDGSIRTKLQHIREQLLKSK
ncbi:F0F1 ATP synthase subunit delta [Lactobacillus sp. PV037]|uniref:F0F1 ATP synthase subunit delta n=1 Tax=unclassified Lactobacillus TaxID=2620435 RepID=UPI00223F3312|nr:MULTISPECIES: F0F1 ATP synthase subunit delta [unclassified Lactobacillus]QNQ82496.1 F0F1 ATP synthase subunit delta [Lactobacillus sp. PV012]QNQ83390.1 F0F1 ATP synthase subunit delta [Lactobacillus sp. PV037]